MLKKHESVAYELLRPEQVREIRAKSPIAYIPAGSLEWHGFQNPLGTDGLKAHAICCEAALRHGGVVLPPFYQGLLGKGWGPLGWGGYTLGYNKEGTFESAILGICRALVAAKWRVIVGVTGHDVPEQRAAMARAIRKATRNSRGSGGFALMEGDLHRADRKIPYHMDHAGAWETSCMMHAYPDKVRLHSLRSRKKTPGDDLDIRGPEGIGGRNPLKYASARLGRRIIERMGDLIGARARAMLLGRRKLYT